MIKEDEELEWTVYFDFPDCPVFPTEDGSWVRQLDKTVKTFDDKIEAKKFALEKCGKYGFQIIPTKVLTCIE